MLVADASKEETLRCSVYIAIEYCRPLWNQQKAIDAPVWCACDAIKINAALK